jgi:hypothetical protein
MAGAHSLASAAGKMADSVDAAQNAAPTTINIAPTQSDSFLIMRHSLLRYEYRPSTLKEYASVIDNRGIRVQLQTSSALIKRVSVSGYINDGTFSIFDHKWKGGEHSDPAMPSYPNNR